MLPRLPPLLVLGLLAHAAALDRCDACCVVLEALAETLNLEHQDEDRQDILSGGRLDSTGKRQGKMIEYEKSEFRSSHLLEQMCRVVSTFSKEPGAPLFLRNQTLAASFKFGASFEASSAQAVFSAAPKTVEERDARELRVYCDSLVEEHEESLARIIFDGTVESVETREAVCVHLAESACGDRAALDVMWERCANAKAERVEIQSQGDMTDGNKKPAERATKRRKKAKKAKSDPLRRQEL